MKISFQKLTLIATVLAYVYADFLGPRFPSPIHFASNDSLVAHGWKNLTRGFDEYLKAKEKTAPVALAGLKNLTFSLGMFSIHDSAAQSLQYHYTSDEVKNGPGIDEVDGDSIYRVASISKLFTVFACMLNFDDKQWNQPITNFIPNLSRSELGKIGDDLVRNINWEGVTLLALAAEIAGIPRESQPWNSDFETRFFTKASSSVPDPINLGLPPLDAKDSSLSWPCLRDPDLFLKDPLLACPPDLYFEGAQNRSPVFPAWTTPGYSNNGFTLLGIALANITNKSLSEVYHDSIFDPLGLTKSSSEVPPNLQWSQCAIPGNDSSLWASSGGLSVSSGGIFSSLNDLTKLATALLNSTLLPAQKTRRWMKPISHTAQLTFSVGAPWEIYRYVHPDTGSVTDIYTKWGDSGSAAGYVVLIPDYGAGFNIISTATNSSLKSTLTSTIADMVTTIMIPALEAEAAIEVEENFAGTYESKHPDLDSSLTLKFNRSKTDPGLHVQSWTSNGTNMIELAPTLFYGSSSVKLQPSISQPGQVAFLAVPLKPQIPPGSFIGPFSEMSAINSDWLHSDGQTYGGQGVSLFIFDVGVDGKATGVLPAATRAKLDKVG